jgi:hypothetical protein
MTVVCNERIYTFIHRTFNDPTFCETYKYAAYDGLPTVEWQADAYPASRARR